MIKQISILSDHDELTKLANNLPPYWKEQFLVHEVIGQDALTLSAEMEKDGIEAIVTTRIISHTMYDKLRLPVITIPITTYDLIYTFEEIKKKSEKIHEKNNKVAVLQLERLNPRIPKIAELLEVEMVPFLFNTPQEARESMLKAFKQGFRYFVGGAIACRVAKELGCDVVPFKIRSDTLIHALQNAVEIAKVRRRERKEVLELHAIFNFAFEGIITSDSQGKINMMNPTASRLLNVDPEKTINKNLTDVFSTIKDNIDFKKKMEPKVVTVGGNKLVLGCVPVMCEGSLQGSVIHLQEITEVQRLEGEIRREIYAKGHVAKFFFSDIVGTSLSIKRTVEYAKGFALSDETVLIEGESGTGKELFAQAIHNGSRRSKNPFVAVNCASLPDNLLESELFGYVEGAFTGAKKGGRLGLFEIAHKGTILLDEIGDISQLLQARLLRVLQEKQIRRVGDDRIIPVDVRVIAVTNRNLSRLVEKNQFRLDLYYRLNVLKLKIPPLRERLQDIPDLVGCFLKDRAGFGDAKGYEVEKALKILQSYSWPGNIRELENILTRFLALSRIHGELSFEEFFKELLGPNHFLKINDITIEKTGSIFDLEERIIRETYNSFAGNKNELAKRLGFSRTTLWRKLKKLNLE